MAKGTSVPPNQYNRENTDLACRESVTGPEQRRARGCTTQDACLRQKQSDQ